MLLALGVPIFMSIGASGLTLFFAGTGSFAPNMMIQRMYSGLNSFTLMAIPLFMLAGEIMNRGQLSKKMVRFANCILGWIPGGLGSASAAAAMIGAILIPEMIDRGYDKEFACALTASAGSIGPIIPPSIPMIVYGVIANVSVVKLFCAGYIPGVLMGVLFGIYTYLYAKKHRYPAEKKPSLQESATAFKEAFLTLLLPVIIMGSILCGVCTATEAAVLAVVYAFFLSIIVYRTLPLKEVPNVLLNGAKSAAMVLAVVAAANMLSWAVTMMNIPATVSAFVCNITTSPLVFLIITNLILIIAGMFLDASSAIMILTPVLLPIALQLGVDPLVFGIIITVNLSIGVLTPPVGLNRYVVSSLSKVDILRIAKAAAPFMILIFMILIMASAWPRTITFLPNLLYH